MTATTSSPPGDFKDDRPARCVRLTVFSWHARIFRGIARAACIEYVANEAPEPPHMATFQFECGPATIAVLVQGYLEAGYPFDISNFNRESAEEPGDD